MRLLHHDAHVLNLRTRFPFRHGIATLTACPHLFVRVTLEIDGKESTGITADHLPPKWFTKNPATSYQDDLVEMIAVINHAAQAAAEVPPTKTLYEFWQNLNAAQHNWAASKQIPQLLASFGTSLIERAAIDAFCRANAIPFPRALRENLFGIQNDSLSLLPREPLREVLSRHTVGLTDPITDADIPPDDRLADGLPQSLEQCIAYYGLTRFKIKLSGDVARDTARLQQIAALLDATSPDYAFTLDGNETFHDIDPLRALWEAISGDATLRPFLSRLLFLEQPLHRDIALSDSIRASLSRWPNRSPMIIDESDASLESLPRALDCGYAGTSHKNCKGVFKGITNACRIAALKLSHPDQRFILSGEDLSNVGPVSLPQDLAVMATLGIDHVERNGQHYFKGLSFLPPEMQAAALAAQPDLYRQHERGFVTLNIKNGLLLVGTCLDAPFGVPFTFNPTLFTPLDAWTFSSL